MSKWKNFRGALIFIIGILFLQLGLYLFLEFGLWYLVLSISGTYLLSLFIMKTGTSNNKGSTETIKSNLDQGISENLFNISETMSIDIQQLLWLSINNIEAFGKLVKFFHKIQENGEQNAASAQEITASMEEFVSNFHSLNENILEVEQQSDSSYKMLAANKSTMANIQQSMLDLSQSIKETSTSHDKLHKSSQEINKIVEYIQGISSQINLLSLNASIEAARAGEAGRGFSVVAQEIKKLSEETNNATTNIKNVVDSINEDMNVTNSSIVKMVEEIQHTEVIAKESSVVVSTIEEIISSIKKSLETVRTISQKQLMSSNEIKEGSHSFAVAVEETHGMLYELLKTVETQQGKNDEIIEYSNKLGDISEEFQETIVKLKKDTEIIFGVNPFTSPENIKTMYAPILASVCKEVGCQARIIIVKNYETLNDWISKGKIDIGWFSPLAYVKAREKTNVVPLATPIVNGKASYIGYIIARKDSSIKSLNDLSGSTFGYVDKNSASGYLFANYIMSQERIYDSSFSRTVFLGSHDKVIQAVLSGEVDAGATYSEAIDFAVQQGLPVDKLEIIASTDPIPKDVIGSNENLPKELVDKLKEAFIDFTKPSDINSPVDGFTESKDNNYDIIRNIV
ncbi:phosphate/phosphite/phosphonate ABC transporter substrate-binding protein [Alkalicella caledoniensis]|uniref:Phosphate/phosphite/phosphonate ABC transporter substrate-binding protein n=1 Tax=Alkalicella caledoniensis TaxID=2731377 RepID=A0A7G9W6E9_ALKCA|nr:phosphate/phosphite/phosphonate ABC transporter substrate-binding protein [Alkalicella caledoniensis]QNO14261.1 phosphate/phosphite/phosphonate ABC transporter substrate-binding protein [Alkalicella caledoniensis]